MKLTEALAVFNRKERYWRRILCAKILAALYEACQRIFGSLAQIPAQI